MSRVQGASERYRRMSPDELLGHARELQTLFGIRLDPATGKAPKLSTPFSFEITEHQREILEQLLDFLGTEGLRAHDRIRAIQGALTRMDHQTEAQRELLAWSCEQWWVETDKTERGRLMTRLHDGMKAPPPKDRPREPRRHGLNVAGKSAHRPGGLSALEPK